MFASRKAKLIAASGIIGLAGLAVPGTAFAAATPGPTTGPVAGTITIPTTLTLSINFNAFNVSPANPTDNLSTELTSDNDADQAYIEVGSNDAGGYYVTETGPTDFADGSATIADSYVSSDSFPGSPSGTPQTAGNHAWLPLSASPQTIITMGLLSGHYAFVNSGDDDWVFNGYTLSSSLPANTPAGTFTGDVTFSLWGN